MQVCDTIKCVNRSFTGLVKTVYKLIFLQMIKFGRLNSKNLGNCTSWRKGGIVKSRKSTKYNKVINYLLTKLEAHPLYGS